MTREIIVTTFSRGRSNYSTGSGDEHDKKINALEEDVAVKGKERVDRCVVLRRVW